MTNLIKTAKKVISCVSGENTKEFKDSVKQHEKIVRKIIQGNAEKMMVLNFVLRELPKLSDKHKWIRFDFGTQKEFELRRLK